MRLKLFEEFDEDYFKKTLEYLFLDKKYKAKRTGETVLSMGSTKSFPKEAVGKTFFVENGIGYEFEVKVLDAEGNAKYRMIYPFREPPLKESVEYTKENPVNVNYPRVIPRDLFNEAKLLKCIGKVVLYIHDNDIPEGFGMSLDASGKRSIESRDHGFSSKPFKIGLMNDGSLTITNLEIFINGVSCVFKTTYNSKSNWPLFLEYELTDYPVFTEEGKFDEEFIEIAKTIK